MESETIQEDTVLICKKKNGSLDQGGSSGEGNKWLNSDGRLNRIYSDGSVITISCRIRGEYERKLLKITPKDFQSDQL